MSNINVISSTQKIILDPAGGSVGVVSAGPMGPRGLTGPSEASLVLVVDGQLLTRVGGVLTPITRANLAADSAFSGLYVPKSILANDGEILTRAAGVVAPITRANLANDIAFTSKYVPKAGGVILTDSIQSIPVSSVTLITWGTEVSDPDGWISGGGGTLTVPSGKGGRYIVTFSVAWVSSPGTLHGALCNLNTVSTWSSSDSGLFSPETLTFMRTLVAGDTLDFYAFQNSAAAVNATSRLEIASM